MNKSITIKEVAELSNVSKSTVSRVLSNSPKISQKTKDKVYEAMKTLGYHPNEIARSLANSKTNTIGIVMPLGSKDFYSNTFFQESLRGISHIAIENGYDILISTSKISEIEVASRFIQSKKVDGIILMRSKIKDETIEFLKNSNFPFVLIGSCLESDSIFTVDNDNFLASYELTKHILDTGRKKIAFIGGSKDSIVTIKRLQGYKEALKDYDLKENKNYIYMGDFEEEKGYDSMGRILELEDKPDALIVADDLMCMGAIKKAKEKNKNIPKDIAIASFNESSFLKYSIPSITAVEVCSITLGEAACDMLIKIIEKHKIENKKIIKHNLLIRESTQS